MLKKLLKILSDLKYNIKFIPLYIHFIFLNLFGNGAIIVRSWVDSGDKTGIAKNNWGDDLNKYLLERLTEKRVLFIPDNLTFNQKNTLPTHFMFIGSILTFYNLDNAVIYGTGIKSPNDTITGKPSKIVSVRGPKTRQRLLENNIDCPQCYGDPALLLPYVYTPKKTGKKDIILIPNEGTPNDIPLLNTMRENGFSILNMAKYDEWTDIIDSIAGSEFVVSESLHGLIVAEAYGVPSVWVEFIEHPSWWSFKYNDFYESVNKFGEESIKLYENCDLNQITQKAGEWKRGSIDYRKMIEAFPFDSDFLK